MTITPFERWLIWLSTAGTLVTGVAYWWMKDLMTPAEPWAVINHPLQPWMLKAHILVAPVLVFGVGMITARHVWAHFRQRVEKGRRSGLTAALTFAALAATGYILPVLTAETLLRILGWTHLGLGIVYSAGLALHWPATRARGAAAEPSSRLGTRHAPAAFGEGRAPAHDRRRRRRSAGGTR
ncbi:MAG TPA: hypothetical protein VMM12_17875 [Longimicrobiales bacterium]|nr:hypothetical protein [Longimicrobiales bacterium]